jgi:hypothetical protein
MSDPKIKEGIKAKLSQAVKDEIKKDKVTKTIDSVKIDDGIITARFSVRMPKGKDSESGISPDMTYEDFTKNFKTPEEFNQFVWEEFFNDFNK